MLLSIFTLGILLGPRSEKPEFLSGHRDRLALMRGKVWARFLACTPIKVR